MNNELFDASTGERLYLNAEERKAFFIKAQSRENDIKYYSLMLYYSGCRPQEGLNLTVGSIDFEDKSIVVRSIKKNRKDKPTKEKIHYRRIPLPDSFLNELAGAYDLRKRQKNQKRHKEPIWGFTVRTARRYVKSIMAEAEITGKKACPKGLRHAFGIAAVEQKIPITEVQKLMGHAFLTTTSIYTNVQGKEKRNLVSRMWE